MELINKIDETFKFENKEIRLSGSYNEPLFVAKDICDVLELSNITNSLRNIPEKWMTLQNVKSSYNSQNMIFLTEPAVYKLIMRSNKPIAQKFQEVVCEEILPSLRRKGEYKIQSIIDKNKELEEEKLKILNKNKELEEEKKNIKVELENNIKENKQLHTLVKKKERKRYSYNHSVYIISNPDIKNSYKLGLTADRNQRLENLGPGAPRPYFIEYSRELCNANEEKAIESLLLGIFDKYRYETEIKNGKQREWIQNIDLNILIEEMDKLVDYYQEKKAFFTDKFKKENFVEKIIEPDIIIPEKYKSTIIFEDEKDIIHENKKIEIINSNVTVKICYVCKESKTLDEYYNRIENKDGKEGTCKKCYSNNKKILKEEKDKREFIVRPEGTKKCRKCLNIKSFENFAKHGTSKDGYEYACIECRSHDAKNLEEKCCSSCKKTKKISDYQPFRLGYSKYCNDCVAKDEKYKQTEIPDIKKCSLCEKEKNIINFSKCKTSLDGYYRYCRECSILKSKEYKEKQKNKTKDIISEKQCSICKTFKNTTQNFHKNNIANDGFRTKCIDCCNKISTELRNSKIF
jgi:prophage antirepressor-like protein